MSKLDDVISEVRRVAAERPDYVYVNPEGEKATPDGSVTCAYYTEDGCPSCIIGFGAAPLLTEDERKAEVYNGSGADVFIRNNIPGLSREENASQKLNWLRRVQWYQDHGTPWGEAVWHADRAFPNV